MGIIERLIRFVLVRVAVDGAMKTMERDGKKPGERLFGHILVLKPNTIVKILVYGYLILSLFLAGIGIFAIESRTDLNIYMALMAFLFILNFWLFIACGSVRIEVDNANITRYRAFSRTKRIWWNEISSVKITSGSRRAIIIGEKVRITVNSNFIGYNDFLAYINKKVDSEVIQAVEMRK